MTPEVCTIRSSIQYQIDTDCMKKVLLTGTDIEDIQESPWLSLQLQAFITQGEEKKANKKPDVVLYVFVFIEFLQYISLHLHILPTAVAFFLHVERNWKKSKGLIYFKQLIKIAKY